MVKKQPSNSNIGRELGSTIVAASSFCAQLRAQTTTSKESLSQSQRGFQAAVEGIGRVRTVLSVSEEG
jgi:hypothetical protein